MAGGLVKYRHLSRDSAHRQALLRNLVTSLVKFESIQTTWPKAKEAQRLAEKLITLAKRNNEPCRRNATAILYVCATFFLYATIYLSIYLYPSIEKSRHTRARGEVKRNMRRKKNKTAGRLKKKRKG